MFAVYASAGNIENPLTSLVVGERPEPAVPEGWVRVKVPHASLNRIFYRLSPFTWTMCSLPTPTGI